MNIWRWTAILAAVCFAFMMAFPAIPGLHACASARDPIVALELARSAQAVAALFPAPCAKTLIAAQVEGLRLDTFGFIPVYVAFLILSARAARKAARPSRLSARLFGAVVTLTLLAAAFDLAENSRLSAILAALPGQERDIAILAVAARAKFILLGAALIALGLLQIRMRDWRRWLGFGAVVGGPVSAIGVLVNPGLIALGASVAWLSLLIFAFTCAVWPPRPEV